MDKVQVGAWTLVRQPNGRKYKWKAVSSTGRAFGYGNTKNEAIKDARKMFR
jgi:hypothetical protein